MPNPITLVVNGTPVEVPDDGAYLLETLRDRLGLTAAKDGCSPQGQCGCCTVLIDGQPRVSCVTPTTRVRGRAITTLEGLVDADQWALALCATGGSQCGFCTPGIIMRLASRPADPKQALLAHLCRCTGWQTILEAAALITAPSLASSLAPGVADTSNATDTNNAIDTSNATDTSTVSVAENRPGAARRAEIEGHHPQKVSAAVALGGGGFADDTAPAGSLVAVRAADGTWAVGETLTAARRLAGKIQGRRTTAAITWPIEVPPGPWHRTLQTTWVEPAYLEPDASWCVPGGEPVTPLANGGAFGAKVTSDIGAIARQLADEHGAPVKAVYSREDVVRLGPKRPPLAIGIREDGSGVVRVVRTPGIAAAIHAIAPLLSVEEVDITGLSTSFEVRAAGWAEAAVLLSSLGTVDTVTSPEGAVATATIAEDGCVHINVQAGEVLDEVVLRSYCIGAAHQALGWVRSEAIAVDAEGVPHDLTVRSFGILRAADMPMVYVTIEPSSGPAVNGSDAVFAAVAAATWRHSGWAPAWPCHR